MVQKARDRGVGRVGASGRRAGEVAEVADGRTAEGGTGGGGARRQGGRQEAGRVRGGERSRCGRWEAVEGGARTFLDQQAPTDRAHARWLCTRAWRSRWCVPQPLARALRGRLDKARLVGAGGLTGPLHATHARADATARDQPASGAGPVRRAPADAKTLSVGDNWGGEFWRIIGWVGEELGCFLIKVKLGCSNLTLGQIC